MEPTPEQILQINTLPKDSAAPQPKTSSVGWVIFWLILFTPWGWYLVWKRTNWSVGVKLAVILVTATIFIGLLIETQLISSQIAGSAIDMISLPM
jgi:hypothetical protein